MPKPFFTEGEKRSLLIRIAKGADLVKLAFEFGLTVDQIRKYTYNHRNLLHKIEQEIANDLLMEVEPPLDRVKHILGSTFGTKHGRIYLNGKPATIREAIRRANLRLIMEGKPVIYYPGLLEPFSNDQ